ncbi:uncharacterized protein N7518_003709 [Penicillium psychrosexuale]|uniref:uncharacterized protein n=1 Tax=Penicillium psychrosexuale TaxID=1002107 RepID=UPI0025453D3A|nr:uncharacterized protein N7518_003709 [Penicillium psychrosexuale]KAJ5801641.1 hypothetical protein N7518_003709 [Penicillium psychrosexuale]
MNIRPETDNSGRTEENNPICPLVQRSRLEFNPTLQAWRWIPSQGKGGERRAESEKTPATEEGQSKEREKEDEINETIL